MRRTKIVATVGPSTRAPDSLKAILAAGVDVVRVNLAHETRDAHEAAIAEARRGAAELNRPVGILVDLPGPKMRTGTIAGGEVDLTDGQDLEISPTEIEGDGRRISTTVDNLADLVSEGDEIFLADGEIVLRVVDIRGRDVATRVVRGGKLRSRKGLHIPGAESDLQAFTAEDEEALGWAVSMRADFVGLSFVRDSEDVERARAVLPKRGPRPLIVAKIETGAAVENIDGIVGAADAVMVARGDLGIQTPLRRVPLVQKSVIAACNAAGVPVITATEMLESMTDSPLPSRAEVTDVANAVLDGTDAVMLSEETAVGLYPMETVMTMAEIASSAEERFFATARPRSIPERGRDRVSWAVAHAAVQASTELDVAAVICPTRSGATPRRIAAFRPPVPVVGLASAAALGSLMLLWGVVPVEVSDDDDGPRDLGAETVSAIETCRRAGLVSEGDLVTIVAGSPGPRAGRTDYMRVARA